MRGGPSGSEEVAKQRTEAIRVGRTDRMKDHFRSGPSEMIRPKIHDRRTGLATVTRVKVSPDLHHARVFITVLGDAGQRKKTLEGLRSAASYARHSLSKR